MEHLYSAWPAVKRRLRTARAVMLLSDYDGTLTPIVERPELAELPWYTRRILEGLVRQTRFTVGIISGRALSDLKARLNIGGIIYAGNHGMEIEGPGVSFVNPIAQELRPILRVLHRVLDRTVGGIKGVLVEDKGLSLSVHYRLVEEHRAGDVKHAFERAVGTAEALGKVRITGGKKVYEVRPAANWDKGKAIDMLMRKYFPSGGGSEGVPFYFGDDITDEDGFRAIENAGGISVLVGQPERDSAARYFVTSPARVATFLSLLLDSAKRGFK